MIDIEEMKRLAALPGDIGYNELAFWMADHAGDIIGTIERLKRELDEARKDASEMNALIPRTPQEMIDFIGSNFNRMQTHDEEGKTELPLDTVCYSLTVHDLLSAFSWSGIYEVAKQSQG